MSETVFISANNGGIEVGIGVGNKVGFAKTKCLHIFLIPRKSMVK